MAKEKPKKEGPNPEPPDKESKEIMEEIKGKKKSPKTPEEIEEEAGVEEGLEPILEKDPSDLSDDEKETLRKQEESLTDEQKKKYKDVLKPPKEKEEEEEGKEEVKPQRTPKLIPLFKHKIAEKKWGKTLKEKEEEILDLQTQLKEKESEPEREKTIKDFCEKHSMESGMVEDLLKIIGPAPSLPKDVKEGIESLKEEKEKQRQSELFDEEYEKNVIPHLTEIGVPDDRHSRLKKLLKTLAFTTDYATAPLLVIYKGVDEFRIFEGKGKKSAETSRGKPPGTPGEPITGEDIMDMEDDEFEKWSDDQAKKEKKFNIVRGGEEV